MKQKKSPKKPKISLFTRFKKYYKNNPKNRKYIIIAIIISIGLTYWLGAIAIEKLQFAKADKALDSFVSDIQVELGKPSVIKKDKSCVETGDKYQINGLPSCSISYYLEYPVSSAEVANEYQAKIDSSINKYFKVTYDNISEFINGKNGDFNDGSIIESSTNLVSCWQDIQYFDPEDISNNYTEDHKITLSTGCGIASSHWNHYAIR